MGFNVRLGDGAASNLAIALRELTRLETLGLAGRSFGSNMKTLTAAVGGCARLRELTLYNTPIGDDGAGHLAAMLERNASLSMLSLQLCRIGDSGLERLGRALTRNTTLRQLDVRGNECTAVGVARFA